MREHLGVAVRAKPVAGALELAAQLLVVVDLAVLDDGDRAVLVRERLVARLEVDDREPARGEADVAVDERAVGVGAAVDERRAHLVQTARVADDPADSAHGGLL